jgi:polyisoprenyl-teichoic acid--peptidoglycan teichoic acid transferase
MPEEPTSSSRRFDQDEPPLSRAELRYPPGAYYRRIALGTLLPGAGLLGTRWKVLGWLLVLLSLAAGVWVLVKAYQGGLLRSALDVAVQPELLQWVGVGIMVGAVLWIGSIVLTAEQSWPRRRSGRWARVLFAALACTVVAAPSAMAVRYLDVQSSVIDQVFVQSSRGEGRDVALSNTAAEDPWADVPRVNTLLIGSDAGKDRWGTRTDSMMVVSTNTKTGDTLLIGIPRNLENVPFPTSNPLHALYPNGYNCGDECLMNGIWTLAEGRPDLFPGVKNPGRKSTVDVVGEITGLKINQSVVINLRGFKALVDAMGGVDVNVRQRVCVECHTGTDGGVVFTSDKQEYIEPGLQHLDGMHALWYARSRAGSDDFSRMRRQRCVAGALMEQADPVGLLQSYPQLAKVVKDNVSIDIPREELSAWVDLALRIQKGGSIRSLPLTSDVVRPGNPDFAKIRALVKKGLKPPKAKPTSSASPSPTTSATQGGTPSPTPTPDDSEALSLTATC